MHIRTVQYSFIGAHTDARAGANVQHPAGLVKVDGGQIQLVADAFGHEHMRKLQAFILGLVIWEVVRCEWVKMREIRQCIEAPLILPPALYAWYRRPNSVG
jgi:hypothetical protein